MRNKTIILSILLAFLCPLFCTSGKVFAGSVGTGTWFSKYLKDNTAEDSLLDDEEEEMPADELTPFERNSIKRIFTEPTKLLNAKPIRLTIEDCVTIALKNNAKVQATEYGVDAARAQRKEASAVPFPIFEYSWDTAPVPNDVNRAVKAFFDGEMSWFNRLKIGMGIPIYAFGKLKTAQELADKGIEKSLNERKKEQTDVVFQVRQLYYGVQLAQELGKLLKDAYKRLDNAIKENEQGESKRSPIDILKAKLFLVDLERRIAETQQKEYLALEALRVQLGLSPDVAITTYSDDIKPYKVSLRPLDEYLQVAESERAEMRLLDVAVDASRLKDKLQRKSSLPDIGFGGYFEMGRTSSTIYGVTATGDFNDPFNYTRAGVGLRLNGKFDPHGNAARVKKTESEYYKVNLERYIAKEGIRLEVKRAYLDSVREKDNVYRAKRAAKLARSLMFMTKSNADLGVGEEREYTDALQLTLLTKGLYYESIFKYNVALAQLDAQCGIIPINDKEMEIWQIGR